MNRRMVSSRSVGFLTGIVILLAAGLVQGQGTVTAQDPVDARSAALGGVSGGDGDFLESLWHSPGLLGSMNRNLAVFQRGYDEDKAGGLWTRDQLGLRRSSLRYNLALGLSEARIHDLDALDQPEANIFDRRLALGFGRTLKRNGSLGMGFMGTFSSLDTEAEDMVGFGGGMGFHYAPTPRFVFAPSVLYFAGERYEDLDTRDRIAWNFLAAADLDENGLLVVAEYHDPGSGKSGLRGGVEADLLQALWSEKDFRLLDEAAVRLGVNRHGLTFGAGIELLDFRFDVASGRDGDGRFTSWSIAHAWGAPQREFRRVVIDQERTREQMEQEAVRLRRRGEYLAAAATYDSLATGSEGPRFVAEAEKCREYQALLEQADQHYFQVDSFGEIGDSYRKLHSYSPEFDLAERRKGVVERITLARELIAHAHGETRTRDLEQARRILDEVQTLEPDLPLLEATYLQKYDLLDLDLRIGEIYPAMYRHYEKHPMGELVITNGYPIQIDEIRLTFKFKGLMADRDLEKVEGLAPGDSVSIPLYAEFVGDRILDPALEIRRQAEIHATIVTPTSSLDRMNSASVRILDHNHMNWSNPQSLAAFVNPMSRSIRRLLLQATDFKAEDYAEELPERSHGLFNSMLVFNLCKQAGVRFQRDPQGTVGLDATVALDVVNRPEQTLAARAGDCDDLVVLWSSLLMSQGVAATGVLLPDHIMLLADTGIPAGRWEDTLLPREMLILREGRVWLPLEATTQVGSFYSMIRYSAEVLAEVPEEHRVYIPFAEAGVIYPPAGIDRGDVQLDFDAEALRAALEEDIRDLGERRSALRSGMLQESQEDFPAMTCDQKLDRAVALAVVGELDAADQLLIDAAGCQEMQVEILNNRGAIALKQGDYLAAVAFFEQALVRRENDWGTRVNLSLARFLASGAAEADSTLGNLDDGFTGFQDMVASLGPENITSMLGGVTPNFLERGLVHGTSSENKIFHTMDEALNSSGSRSEDVKRLRGVLDRAGYREGEPPVVFRRSGDVKVQEPVMVDGEVRHTNIDFPEKIKTGTWETLRVQVVDPFTYDERGQRVGYVELLTGEAGFPVAGVKDAQQTIYFRVSGEGVQVQGEEIHTLTVPTHGASNIVEVPIQAVDSGSLSIDIMFYQNGRPLGTVTRTAVALDDTMFEAFPMVQTQANLGKGGTALDLMVEIESDVIGNGFTEYRFLLHSSPEKLGYNVEEVGTTRLNLSPAAWLKEQFRILEDIKDNQYAAPEELEDHLVSLGRKVFRDLMPAKLQELLKSRDDIETVVFKSQEALIPWELAYFHQEDEDPTEGRFLAERCQVSRWSGSRDMPYEVPVGRALLVTVWMDKIRQPINDVTRTQAILSGMGIGGFEVSLVDPSYGEMARLFADEEIGLYHFECHGDFADGGDLSTLYLRDGRLRAQYLGNPNYSLGRTRPLIFLDACHAGRTGQSLAGSGGWAAEAMEAGASVFIAPLWEVDSRVAGVFSAQLYRELSKGAPLGQAVASAREAARQQDASFSWLAYTVYGDPKARLVVR